MNAETQKDISIIDELIEHSRGKLCSRYIIGLERARDSLQRGSSKKAIEQQDEWFENIRKAKSKVRK